MLYTTQDDKNIYKSFYTSEQETVKKQCQNEWAESAEERAKLKAENFAMKLMRECDESEVCRERALKKFDLSRDELREERYLSSNLTVQVQ